MQMQSSLAVPAEDGNEDTSLEEKIDVVVHHTVQQIQTLLREILKGLETAPG